MNILENIALGQYTTFKIGGPARFFCSVTDEDEVVEAVKFAAAKKLPVFILGEGSNILISDKGFAGLVIKMEIKGIAYRKEYGERSKEQGESKEQPQATVVSAGAGEMWDALVEETVSRGLYGLENLSAIPGSVGAAPVQNIGAYGVEAAETVVSVRAFDTRSSRFVKLANADCRFAYRDSVFKHEKGRYIITRVDFKLSKDGKVNLEYKDLAEYFENKGYRVIGLEGNGYNPLPSLSEVRKAVIDIRWNKLPDWKLWGTAGSFFKNPVVPLQRWIELKQQYPDLPGFPEPDGRIKASLGYIIDKICRMKGFSVGHVSTYEKQALVLVATPGATASEVVAVAQEVMKRVKEKTGIEIEGEVEWVN